MTEPAPDISALVRELVAAAGGAQPQLVSDLIHTALGMGTDGLDELDLKIASAALREMRTAFDRFVPYRAIPKVTVFGSARVRDHEPLYIQARDVARALADHGYMVVTGAGPGLMQAAMEGAGRERSFGVTIRLPWEGGANSVIAGDDKLVSMKYFFTRKLMLIKESTAFISLPGGFGTLDEAFELLTLTQTGKGVPVPIVLLDVPGGSYWRHWTGFIAEELAGRGLINDEDLGLFLVTDDVDEAIEEIVGFYRSYHSIRFVGDRLVIRHRVPLDDAALARLNEQFASLCVSGGIERVGLSKAERDDGDGLELSRIALRFDSRQQAGLRRLIDAINEAAIPPG